MRRQEAAAYAAVETERQVLTREEGLRASQRPVWQAPLPLNGQMRQRSPDRVVRLGRPRRRWVVFNLLWTGSSVFWGLGRHNTSSVHGVRHRDHRRRGRGCLQTHEPTPASTLAGERAQVCLTLTAAYLGEGKHWAWHLQRATVGWRARERDGSAEDAGRCAVQTSCHQSA